MDTTQLQTRPIDDALSITQQLDPDDMQAVARQGFRSVVNNRPDYEGGPAQPTSAQLEAAARAHGLEYRHLPASPSGHSEAQARAMADLVDELPQPVLGFCRTGARSAALYQKGRSLVSSGQ